MLNVIRKRDAGFIITIALVLIALLHTCDKSKRVEHALESEQKKAIIWQDKFGRSNAEVAVVKEDLKTFKTLHGNIVDSLSKALAIKPRTVTKIQTVTTQTTDTVTLSAGRFSDRWSSFSLTGNTLVYSFKDSLALVSYKKGYGFLHLKTKYVTRVVSFNPNTKLTGLTSLEIIPKERRLHLGMYAGYGIQLSGGAIRVGPSVGVGVTYRLY